jgi:hypothetical protein
MLGNRPSQCIAVRVSSNRALALQRSKEQSSRAAHGPAQSARWAKVAIPGRQNMVPAAVTLESFATGRRSCRERPSIRTVAQTVVGRRSCLMNAENQQEHRPAAPLPALAGRGTVKPPHRMCVQTTPPVVVGDVEYVTTQSLHFDAAVYSISLKSMFL